MTDDLTRLANRVVWPGFLGSTVPAWLEKELGDGLAGVVYFAQNLQGDTAELSRRIHEVAPSALIGIDEEGGSVTRLETATGSTVPGAAQLGAVDDLEATRATAAEIARRCDAIGADVVLGPVADVNTDARNPVIGTRSFGDSTVLVSRHAAAAVRGIQQVGLAACAKHFPGHGDTHVDSHHDLPRLDAPIYEITSQHLPPFAAVVGAGAMAIMTAHIVVPAWGEAPATLNPQVLGLLRDAGFDGVIITDALDMAAIRETVGLGPGAVAALAAGADLLCVGNPTNPGDAMLADQDERDFHAVRDAIVAALEDGSLPIARVEQAATRVTRMAARVRSRGVAPREEFDPDAVVRRAVTVEGSFVTIPDAETAVIDIRRRSSLAVDSAAAHVVRALSAGGTVIRLDATSISDQEVRTAVAACADAPVLVLADMLGPGSAQRTLADRIGRELPNVTVVDVGVPSPPLDGVAVISVRGAGLLGAQRARRMLIGE
ncbi:glycoside hydrolase family 3 N-terminal domain-containing protein [Microbacterium sp. NPDC089987]|uniref:glycoside hydrolase family 3 N-terminal domain-containing protein n=1 Tax=Microbacterium sp. NPDC089987 TaxID=3364202 RepID=UPI0037F69551